MIRNEQTYTIVEISVDHFDGYGFPDTESAIDYFSSLIPDSTELTYIEIGELLERGVEYAGLQPVYEECMGHCVVNCSGCHQWDHFFQHELCTPKWYCFNLMNMFTTYVHLSYPFIDSELCFREERYRFDALSLNIWELGLRTNSVNDYVSRSDLRKIHKSIKVNPGYKTVNVFTWKAYYRYLNAIRLAILWVTPHVNIVFNLLRITARLYYAGKDRVTYVLCDPDTII